jgi:phytanoyl-CoA hydroxylase
MTVKTQQALCAVSLEQMSDYAAIGYFIAHDLWTSAEIDKLNRAADELPPFRDGTFAPVMHPHRQHPAFLEALANPQVVAVMEHLLGGPVSGLQTQFFYCRPGTQGFSRHQDNYYVEAPPNAFASAWTALQDVTVENGALIFYPGTHREATLPVEACPDHRIQDGQDPNANKVQAVLPPGYKGVDCPVRRGDTVFLHGHTVHSSHPNRSDSFRRALLMTYLRRGVPFRPGNNAKRSEVDVYSANAPGRNQ